MKRTQGESSDFDVVVPARNSRDFIEATVESALNQTIPPSKIIVVDDGSTDLTAQVALKFPKVEVYKGGGLGAANARNIGVAHSRARFVAFLDADDIARPRRFEAQLEALKSNPSAALCFCDVEYIDREGRQSGTVVGFPEFDGDNFWAQLLQRNRVATTSAAMVRREDFLSVGGFDPSLAYNEEYDLWLRLAKGFGVVHVPEALVGYRLHSANISRSSEGQRINEALALKKHPVEEIRQAMVRLCKSQSGAELALSGVLFRRGEFAQGLELLKELAPEEGERALYCFMRGNFEYKAGNLTLAGDFYRQSLDADSAFAPALNNLGVLLALEGSTQEALICFNKASSLIPAYGDASFNAANIKESKTEGLRLTFAPLRKILKPQN